MIYYPWYRVVKFASLMMRWLLLLRIVQIAIKLRVVLRRRLPLLLRLLCGQPRTLLRHLLLLGGPRVALSVLGLLLVELLRLHQESRLQRLLLLYISVVSSLHVEVLRRRHKLRLLKHASWAGGL